MKPSTPPHNTSGPNKIFEVNQEDTLLKFLFDNMKGESKTTVKSYLSHKQISINGRSTTQFDSPLKPGDKVMVCTDKNQPPLSHPQLNIVYEDDSVIVVDKASGLLSMATEQIKEKTAYRILSDHVKQTDPRNNIFILHRLDRETSGLMMFAKNTSVQEKLQRNWDNVVRERKYIAVVEGTPVPPSNTIKSYITENSAFVVHKSNAEEGKLAITHYKVTKSNREYALVELELETGRKNQIRVHMQEIGHPVTGDKKYGARTNPLNRLALHAFKLNFVHPVTGKEMKFETPVPKRFMLLVKNRA